MLYFIENRSLRLKHIHSLFVLELLLSFVPMVADDFVDLVQHLWLHPLRKHCLVDKNFGLRSSVMNVEFHVLCLFQVAMCHLILDLLSYLEFFVSTFLENS